MQIYNRIKKARGAIFWALIVIAIVELYARESRVSKDIARLHRENWYDNEKQLVEGLVQGCAVHQRVEWLPLYFVERLFGTCHELRKAPLANTHLSGAKLSGARFSYVNFRNADLSHANLSYADLSDCKFDNANLFSADLSFADFSDTNLFDATLRNADLSGADFSSAFLPETDLTNANLNNAVFSYANLYKTDLRAAILLNTNLDPAVNLTLQQLEGDNPPFICNARFPKYIEIDSNRDCDQLAQVLHQRYPKQFESLQKAEDYVNKQRQKG
ncbi:MAG: pentapeptide repeat-containing protein [Pseudanabaenales cyanobacterium]|nr:pentapeptide repeat-containing protein [Pseudanabaenales cyanobacterium]